MKDIYRKIKTVSDLHAFLSELIRDGKGNCPVEFDTEARKFDYHLALIGGVSWMPPEYTVSTIPALIFHEASKKQADEISEMFFPGGRNP